MSNICTMTAYQKPIYYRVDIRYNDDEGLGNWIVGINVLPTLADALRAQDKYTRPDTETRIFRVTQKGEEEVA